MAEECTLRYTTNIGAMATSAKAVPSRVNRILARTALEGDPLRFTLKLKTKTTVATTLSFSWKHPANIYSMAKFNGDAGTPHFTNGVRFGPMNKSIIVPPGVSEFTLYLPTIKDGKSEAPEYIGITVDGVSKLTAIASDIPFDNLKWWRTESWFSSQIFGSSIASSEWLNIWLNPQNVGKAKVANPLGGPSVDYATFVQSFIGYDHTVHKIVPMSRRANLNDQPWTEVYTALADLLQYWYSGKVTYAASAPASIRPKTMARFTQNAVIFSDSKTGKIAKTHKKPIIAKQPNRGQIIVLGDSVTDEDARHGSWVNSMRTDLPTRDILNLATGGMGTGGLNAKDAELGAVNLFNNQLLINPTPGEVIIVIGHNNTWRGISPEQTQKDLEWIVGRALSSGAKVALASNLVEAKVGSTKYKAYSIAFTNTAKKFASNKNFSFIHDFYKSARSISGALLDGLHSAPTRIAQDALYSNFRKALFDNVSVLKPLVLDFIDAEFHFSDADEIPSSPDVDRLVQALATFAPPSLAGEVALSKAIQCEYIPALISSSVWKTCSA